MECLPREMRSLFLRGAAYSSREPFLALLNAFVYGVKYLVDPYPDCDLSVNGISSVFDPWIIAFGSG